MLKQFSPSFERNKDFIMDLRTLVTAPCPVTADACILMQIMAKSPLEAYVQ